MFKKGFAIYLAISLLLTSCSNLENTTSNKKESLQSQSCQFNYDANLVTLPHFNQNNYSGWQVDIRGRDLSNLDLKNREFDLINSDFDTFTKWPLKLPKNFKPEIIMENAKDPGLNISKLHKEGITGKGINIAIIDGWMPEDHIEYADRLKLYMSINNYIGYSPKQSHGAAVASIAVGKTLGIAPEANLYYITAPSTNSSNQADFSGYAKAIEQIIKINKSLANDNKIRVLAISSGWTPQTQGYIEITKAIKEASDGGIFVVSSNLFETYSEKFYFYGLKVDALSDRNDVSSYKAVPWSEWINMCKNRTGFDKYYEKNLDNNPAKEQLLIPIGCKTVANQLDKNSYTFLSTSGWSWGIPYIAGLYALACQVKKDITPDIFWNISLCTGQKQIIKKNDKFLVGKIVNPEMLMERLKSSTTIKP